MQSLAAAVQFDRANMQFGNCNKASQKRSCIIVFLHPVQELKLKFCRWYLIGIDIKYPLYQNSMLRQRLFWTRPCKSVRQNLTAETGMDCTYHAIEVCIVSTQRISAALAETSIEICGTFTFHYLTITIDARKKMNVASCLAGLAFNSASLVLNPVPPTLLPIGAKFHIPTAEPCNVIPTLSNTSGINKHSRVNPYPMCVKSLYVANFLV